MKTMVTIDDQLVTQALAMTGLSTQEEVIMLGLQTLINLKQQSQFKQVPNLEGKNFYGCIQDETFIRQPQGQFIERESF
jgi:hypothetical protein